MRDIEITWEMIGSHLFVALVPWLVVFVTGGGLGFLLALGLRRLFQNRPRVLDLFGLIPWRSVSILLPIFMVNSQIMVWQYGLGTVSGSMTVGVALSALVTPWVTFTLLRSWFPFTTVQTILHIARVTALLAIILVVLIPTVNGMGYFIWRVSEENNFQKMNLGYAVVGGMLAFIDILFGLIQWATNRYRFR